MAETYVVTLSPEELQGRALELAQVVMSLALLQREKKEANQEFKEREEELRTRMQMLSAAVRLGREERDAQLALPSLEVKRARKREAEEAHS